MAACQTFSVSQWPGSPFDSIGKVHVDEEEDQQKCKNAPQDDPDSRQRSALDAAVVERMWHGAAKAFFDKRRAGVKAATLGSTDLISASCPLPQMFIRTSQQSRNARLRSP
jgi:hypothetical protein